LNNLKTFYRSTSAKRYSTEVWIENCGSIDISQHQQKIISETVNGIAVQINYPHTSGFFRAAQPIHGCAVCY